MNVSVLKEDLLRQKDLYIIKTIYITIEIFMNEEEKRRYLDALYFQLLIKGCPERLAKKKVDRRRKMLSKLI